MSMIILPKSILAEIDNFSNGHKMHDTVMLVLDDKYVVTEEAIEGISIEGMKFTLPENYIWCLTHMTTSGKERFTIDYGPWSRPWSSDRHSDCQVVRK